MFSIYYNESIEDEIEAMRLLSLGKEYFPFLKREADFLYKTAEGGAVTVSVDESGYVIEEYYQQ